MLINLCLVGFEDLNWNIQSSGVTEWSDVYERWYNELCFGTQDHKQLISGKCLWLELPCLMIAFAKPFGSEANYDPFSSVGITSGLFLKSSILIYIESRQKVLI